MDVLVAVIAWPLAIVGMIFLVAGAVGMTRLPDLYTRLHAASVTDTGGTLVISLVLLLYAVFVYGSAMVAIKLLLIMVFTLFTAPTASHVLAKAALLSGLVPVDENGKPLLDSSEQAAQLGRSRADAQADRRADAQADGRATTAAQEGN
jgi:multicomponent Na+:H+ antiporter subunit G